MQSILPLRPWSGLNDKSLTGHDITSKVAIPHR